MVHPERFQNVILDVMFEFLAADALDDVSSKRESVIGVRRNFTRREDASGHFVHQICAQRFYVALMRDEKILQYFFESVCVSKQLPERKCLRVRFRNSEIEVIIDVAVQIEFSLFDQLHHGCRCE